MHKIVLPLETLTYNAPYVGVCRVYIDKSIGFSKLGFRLETTEAHRFFRHFVCLTLENQCCLAEMIEFQLGKNRCSQLLLYTRRKESAENAFMVTRKIVGHILVYTFGAPSMSDIQ